MKKIKYLILSGFIALGMVSCDDYLDVNTDPDSPSSDSATPEVRLPWIQNYFDYAWGTACMRTACIAGTLTQTSTTSANGYLAKWDPLQSSSTTIYQNFYLGAGVNCQPLIDAAVAQEAYHYAGAACVIYAMGFMMMLDLYGEIPMTEAFTGKYNPVYDDGKALYNQSMEWLDKGIEYFNMENKNVALSDGDTWNNGDVDKWLKMAYGLKARYLLRLSKKSDLYDADAILEALNKGPQSNDDNVSVDCYNVDGDETNVTVGDPYQASHVWNCVGYGSTQRLTRWFINMLDNSFTGGSGVIDPRLSKLVPAAMTHVQLKSDGTIDSFEWTRSTGVDMLSSDNIRLNGAIISATFATSSEVEVEYTISDSDDRATFIANAIATNHEVDVDGEVVKVTYAPGQIYCNSTNYAHAGDTCYVNMRTNSIAATSGRSTTDMYYYPFTNYDYVAGTGTFYARPNSDMDLLTYSEMCFIKAEVLLRKGDTSGALTAYKAGIQANFDRMQDRLEEWEAAGTTSSSVVGENPDMLPMDETEISEYMSSAAVCQSASSLTMAEIMRQKIISMGGLNIEIWNDMRRFNYSAGNIGSFGNVYPDYTRPSEFTATSKIIGSSTSDLTYWFRRWMHSTHESNYNSEQLAASNKLALDDAIWSCPIWWDCETDSEYYGYIQ